jgi:hypothetical protein
MPGSDSNQDKVRCASPAYFFATLPVNRIRKRFGGKAYGKFNVNGKEESRRSGY